MTLDPCKDSEEKYLSHTNLILCFSRKIRHVIPVGRENLIKVPATL